MATPASSGSSPKEADTLGKSPSKSALAAPIEYDVDAVVVKQPTQQQADDADGKPKDDTPPVPYAKLLRRDERAQHTHSSGILQRGGSVAAWAGASWCLMPCGRAPPGC